MKLSRRTEYGLRALVQLGRLSPQSYVMASDVSRQEKLPNKFLEAILLALRRGGFLESKVGTGGGYRLAKPPGEILIADVVRRLEGRLGPREASPAASGDASPGNVAVRMINERLTRATDSVLGDLTLEQLIDQVNRATGAGQEMWYI